METRNISSKRLGEHYTVLQHPSGLTIMLCPMAGFSTAQAAITTQYGSVDLSYETAQGIQRSPAGVAHFLEHKLFESPQGDAMELFARTGANANAYTSFDKTSYYFTCTDQFQQNLEYLLDFVTHPYFTAQTVAKEQGIIAQEIVMYEDDPDWRVYFNLFQGMYHSHPIQIEIAGTVQSIQEITHETLYDCYRTFYNLNNMVLTVTGNFQPEQVLETVDRLLPPAPAASLRHLMPQEPVSVARPLVEQKLQVAIPQFQFGYKLPPLEGKAQAEMLVMDELMLDLLCGESSDLYQNMYEQNLINSTFGQEVLAAPGCYASIFSGESRHPKEVARLLDQEIRIRQEQGFSPALFELGKRALYGRYAGMFERVDSMNSLLMFGFMHQMDVYSLLDRVADLTLEQVQQRLGAYRSDCSTLSIVWPQDGQEETEGSVAQHG